MTSTPTSLDDSLGESWVEVCRSPDRLTPLPFPTAEDYLKLLNEAQRESTNSSCKASRESSVKGSPKSPPNSPNTEMSVEEELKNVYINHSGKDVELIDKNTDWIWDWSSRPDQQPPKDWKFKHPTTSRKMFSIRKAKVWKQPLFSREMMYTIMFTNVLSLILGAGIGVWLCRRGMVISTINIE